jgi:tRNA pseudouridine55 synthase
VHGLLNLYKPTGPTSHDCVSRVRRTLGTRRVGHAGTLDPLARGVLVMGIGNGTRVLEYLHGLTKTYRARMILGRETDSQDVTGAQIAKADASAVTREQVEAALEQFRGEILQVPPMVSALKVGGRKLYELARKGETVEREARPVTIHRLEVLDFVPGAAAEVEFRVECSGGTYVRTLCHDLGAALGVGGVMSELEREAVGFFKAEDAVPLDELRSDTPLLPLGPALDHLPALVVEADQAARLAHGQFISAPDTVPDGPTRILDGAGGLLAIATVRGHGDSRLASPEKVFVSADAASSGF